MAIVVYQNEAQATYEWVNLSAGCVEKPCYSRERVNAVLSAYMSIGVAYTRKFRNINRQNSKKND